MELTANRKNSYINKIIAILEFLAIVVIFLILVKGWLFFSKAENFPIQKVKVVATYNHLDPNLVRQTVMKHVNNGFFDLDINTLKNQLVNLPWVYSVAIKKEWPNSLAINLSEQIPQAFWNNNALINKDGNIFYPPTIQISENLPQFFGPDSSASEMFAAYEKMQQQLTPLHFTITKLSLNPPLFWLVELNNNSQIYLSYEDYQDKLQNFATSYSKITLTNPNQNIDTIDLRYKNGLSIKWR